MDIIIRPAETSDFDSVVHILNQVQALHVNWRPDFMLLHMKCTKNMALQKNQSIWNYYK